MKGERHCLRGRTGSMRVVVFSMVFLWLLVIFRSATAVQNVGELRGKETIHGNTLYHRRTNSNSTEGRMGMEKSDQGLHAPTSVFEIPDLIFGHNSISNHNSNSNSNSNNKQQQIKTIETMNGLEKLIVGGTDAKTIGTAKETRYPWFARVLGRAGDSVSACGGSLVAPDVVITAAHCDDPSLAMIGPYNLRDIRGGIDGNMIRRGVTNIARHPQYLSDPTQRQDYDVMIVSLDEPVLEIAPIQMNFDNSYPSVPGEELQVLGFGSIIGGPETGLPNGPNQQSDVLQQAPSNYVPFDECAVAYDPEMDIRYGVGTNPGQTMVKDYWLCTLNEDTSTCYGDSGGPVIKEGSNASNDLLLGVISGASGYCGNPYLPLLNNRVSSHQDWIKNVGCALSRVPPPYWNCPDRDDDFVPPPVTTPNAAPVSTPAVSPVSNPVGSPVSFPVTPEATPTSFPTISPEPTVSFAPTEIPTGPDFLLIFIATGVGLIAVVGSVGMWMLLRRQRRKRIDDIDKPPSKKEKKAFKPIFTRHKKKNSGERSPQPSPQSSKKGLVLVYNQDDSSEEGDSWDSFDPDNKDDSSEEGDSWDSFDPESQQRQDPADENSGDTFDITPQDTGDSPDSVVANPTHKKSIKRFFPSLFKKKGKPSKEEEEEEEEVLFEKEGENYDDVESLSNDSRRTESRAEDGQGKLMPDNKINDEKRTEVHGPRDTESMEVHSDNEADDYPYESVSMIAQAENKKDYINDFVFPRTYSPSSNQRRKSYSSDFEDDIRAVIHRGRTKSPMRSHSLDRSRANKYENEQFDRVQPRSHSQEPFRANNYASETKQARGRSNVRNANNRFAGDENYNSRPRQEYLPRGERNSRSRGRSRQRLDNRNLVFNDVDQKGDPPGEVYADRLVRPTSLDKARASKFANNGSAIDYGGRRRSLSMNQSGAVQFANDSSPIEKDSGRRRSSSLDRSGANAFARTGTDTNYTGRRRSSSLDRSRANIFATGTGSSPNANLHSGQRNVSHPNLSRRDEGMVEKGSKAGVVITKKADGSIIHEVKRRRADGALVTTKTKYANIKLARKYGVPI